EVFKRSRVRVAALLDPQVFDVKLLAVAIGPEEIGVSFKGRNDVFVVDERNHPFLLSPDAGTVGIIVLTQALIEELDPGRCGSGFEGFGVVMNFDQMAAGRASVDNFEQAILAWTAPNALKPCVIVHR